VEVVVLLKVKLVQVVLVGVHLILVEVVELVQELPIKVLLVD